MVDLAELARLGSLTPLEQITEAFASLKIDTLSRPELGEDLNFLELVPEFRSVIASAALLKTLPLSQLHLSIGQRGFAAFDLLRNRFKQLREFSVTHYSDFGNNPVDARAKLVAAVKTDVQSYFDRIAPVFGFAAALQHAVAGASIYESLDAARQSAENGAKEIQGIVAEITRLLALAQENVQKTGIARHAIYFSQEAAGHEKSAEKWLYAVVGLGVTTTLLALANVILVRFFPNALTTAQSAQVIFAKLLVFSIFASATLWCGRVYRAHRHNYVVNRHRQNALSSFETFAEATDDAGTKNAVLIQATQSIFAPQPSGYTTTESESTISPQMIELVRTVGGTR